MSGVGDDVGQAMREAMAAVTGPMMFSERLRMACDAGARIMSAMALDQHTLLEEDVEKAAAYGVRLVDEVYRIYAERATAPSPAEPGDPSTTMTPEEVERLHAERERGA